VAYGVKEDSHIPTGKYSFTVLPSNKTIYVMLSFTFAASSFWYALQTLFT